MAKTAVIVEQGMNKIKRSLDTSEFNNFSNTVSNSMQLVSNAVRNSTNSASSNINDFGNETDNTKNKVSSNTRGIGDEFIKLKSMISSSVEGITGIIKGGLIASLTSLIPILASVSAGAMAMGSSMASAGVGFLAYGAVAKSVLGDVFESSTKLAEAQKALDDATTADARAKALQMQKDAMAGLSTEQQKAVVSLQSFKDYWKELTTEFEKPVTQAFASSLDILKGVLEQAKPLIQGTANGVQTLLDKLASNMKSDSMQQFFKFLGSTAESSVVSIGTSIGNLAKGFANLLVAFSPLTGSVNNGLISMTQSFATWSANLSKSDGFKTFINYVKTNTPIMISLFKNISSVIGQLVVALAPLGSTVLAGLNTAFGFMANNMNIVLPIATAILSAFAGFKILTTVSTSILAITTAITTLGGAFTVVKNAFTALKIAMMANP